MEDLKLKEFMPDELRQYMEVEDEHRYLLVDVRQPAEYAAVHIPGAVLMPLMELESRLFELPADRELVFYCRTGARSQIAAMLAAEAELSEKTVYNLVGGVLAWGGRKLSDFPRVQVFDAVSADADVLRTAMDLEKGAWRFYRQILATSGQEAFAPAIRELSLAEEGHARMIYAFWKRSQTDPPPFDTLFETLQGEILESGQPLETVLQRLSAAAPDRGLNILELALDIEYRAYDLYRNIAEKTSDAEQRDTLLTIAQAEKKHMRVIGRALALQG
ncbi:MAG: rhodanese-like domain-containing protein [Desulfobacterales bacterium]|nr:rhodanese-like domain-containing protein [Desulfobacterales bacterium]